MKIGFINIFLLFILKVLPVFSQDMQFSQFYASPLYLNPAFTGANVCSRFSLTYRNQWPGISTAYKSYLGSYDHYIANSNIGIGLQFATDIAGTGGLKTTMINPLFAYEMGLNRKYSIRFGVQPGVSIKSINMDKLTFGDQLSRGGKVATVESPVNSKAFFDFGAGGLFYSSHAWIGASFYHLNKPEESLLPDAQTMIPIRYSVHGGYKYNFNKDVKPSEANIITTAFNYRGQGEFDQFDIGFYYTKSLLNIGLWYRGIPGLKAYKPGYRNDDALCLIIGFELEKLNIGYSYDKTISLLASVTKGSHEITMSYQLCKKKPKKKKAKLIACPKF